MRFWPRYRREHDYRKHECNRHRRGHLALHVSRTVRQRRVQEDDERRYLCICMPMLHGTRSYSVSGFNLTHDALVGDRTASLPCGEPLPGWASCTDGPAASSSGDSAAAGALLKLSVVPDHSVVEKPHQPSFSQRVGRRFQTTSGCACRARLSTLFGRPAHDGSRSRPQRHPCDHIHPQPESDRPPPRPCFRLTRHQRHT
jgi:hypothetical protein